MKYEQMSIKQLEDAVQESLADSKYSLVEAINILRYLQTTGRYKESTRYAKESFDTYVSDQFGILPGTYAQWARAAKYPEEAKIFGIGLVSKVVKSCGSKGAKKAFSEISALEEVKKRHIPRAKIEAIIEKHIDPKRKMAVKVSHDWKAQYLAEMAAHEATKKELKKAYALIEQQTEQIRKLKIGANMAIKVKRLVSESMITTV